jgi:catechol 2,3-dioxygenase-like lactoylglutathione lyase family enzyme
MKDLPVHATIPASDLDRARRFYSEKLGLEPVSEVPGGLLYECGEGTRFLLYPTRFAGTARHTLLGIRTNDIQGAVSALQDKDVAFEEYDLPGLKTVNGIARTGEVLAAWFKDSEGNILGIVQLD